MDPHRENVDHFQNFYHPFLSTLGHALTESRVKIRGAPTFYGTIPSYRIIKAMKKVAGTLKLDLAQFRELEAFAKFGSDLDKETQKQLNRGSILMELLKQKQYSPVAVEKQIALIYAGTKGYLDDISRDKLSELEDKFYDFLDASCSELLKDIKESGELSEGTEKDLISKIKDFIKGV